MNNSKKCLLLSILSAVILTGCATVELGHDFKPLSNGSLLIGKTTKDDVTKALGGPSNSSTFFRDGVDFENVIYSYSSNKLSREPSTIQVRALTLWYLKDVLIGKAYCSSFDSDSTDFSTKSSSTIKSGMTKNDVLKILGQPSGELVAPLTYRGAPDEYLGSSPKVGAVTVSVSYNMLSL